VLLSNCLKKVPCRTLLNVCESPDHDPCLPHNGSHRAWRSLLSAGRNVISTPETASSLDNLIGAQQDAYEITRDGGAFVSFEDKAEPILRSTTSIRSGTGLHHLIFRPKCKAFNEEIAKRE